METNGKDSMKNNIITIILYLTLSLTAQDNFSYSIEPVEMLAKGWTLEDGVNILTTYHPKNGPSYGHSVSVHLDKNIDKHVKLSYDFPGGTVKQNIMFRKVGHPEAAKVFHWIHQQEETNRRMIKAESERKRLYDAIVEALGYLRNSKRKDKNVVIPKGILEDAIKVKSGTE